jgi:hypothetical protein
VSLSKEFISMFGSDVLEVAIGTIFVILIVSLLASSIRELIESVLKSRAKQLERGIRTLLDDPTGKTAVKELFDHPMLCGLFEGEYDPDEEQKRLRSILPSYIPSRNFALALLHSVAGGGADATELNFEAVRANASTLPEGRLRQAVMVAVGEAENDLERARASLEAWFDSNMDRVSGWYKRKTQLILLGIGMVLAICLNVDLINVAQQLSSNTAVRQQVAARVDAAYATMKAANGTMPSQDLKNQVTGLAHVIGWGAVESQIRADLWKKARSDNGLKNDAARQQWVQANLPSGLEYVRSTAKHLPWTALIGWILTAIAVSLGAPFWFDLLNKFMVVRATVKPYEKSPAEGSEDRRGPPTAAQQLAVQPALPVPQVKRGNKLPETLPQTVVTTVRAAVDMEKIKPETLRLTKNGQPVEVPPDGFVELDMEPDTFNEIKATAKGKNGKPVSATINRYFSIEDEAQPIDIL